MNTEKHVEDTDKDDVFMRDKDIVAGIKLNEDIMDIIGVSLQERDFTTGLNAEIDLDMDANDSADKDEIADCDINGSLGDKVMNGHREDVFMGDKECVADIKLKVDFMDIIGVSTRDFTTGLNAEVDLDENIDVHDRVNEDETADSESNRSRGDKLMRSHRKVFEESAEIWNVDHSKISVEVLGNTNCDKHEDAQQSVGEANELNDINIECCDMVNKIEVIEGAQTEADGNDGVFREQAKFSNHAETGTSERKINAVEELDNNNEKEITRKIQVEVGDARNTNEAVPGTNERETESRTRDDDSVDDYEEECIDESQTSSDMLESNFEDNREDLTNHKDRFRGGNTMEEQENSITAIHSAVESGDAFKESSKMEPIEIETIEAERMGEIYDVHDIQMDDHEQILDREKIDKFIKEVINDLQGIVIETDECDMVVNGIYFEEAQRDKIDVRAINDYVTDEIVGNISVTEVLEGNVHIEHTIDNVNTDENSVDVSGCGDISDEITDDVTKKSSIAEQIEENVISEKNNVENTDDITDTSERNDDQTHQVDNCELIIKEMTEETALPVDLAENEPIKCKKSKSEDYMNIEMNIHKTCVLSNPCSLQTNQESPNLNHAEGKDTKVDGSSVEEPPNIAEQQAKQCRQRKEKRDDIKMVEQELHETQVALQTSQRCLQDERSKHNRNVMTLKLQLYRSQTQLKQQKTKSEKQLTDIMSRLVMLESRLRREQARMKMEMSDKNGLMENQRNEILKLKDQNEQLLNAIKEICAKGGMNGYMRENRRKNGNCSDGIENSAKNGRDKKGQNVGKLGSMRDKFLSKNRSSLELNSFNLEKYLIKDDRLCSSQEDLRRLGNERRRSIPSGDERTQKHEISPKDRPVSDNSEYKNGNRRKHVRYSHQNFFSDSGSPKYELNKSNSDSSHLSESTSSSSGVHSLSDQDLSAHNDSMTNGDHGNHDYYDDEEDDRIFSFSSTHINTVIDEEDTIGPIMSHSGQMMSMGSMPMLANLKEQDSFCSGKNRPHSLSSVDLASIQQQAQNLSKFGNKNAPYAIGVSEMSTPPASPSYVQSKNELTPFQTFKTMFRRKGSSKNKGHKKRSVSLSQTTNMEYSEALKKHFQKYDMS